MPFIPVWMSMNLAMTGRGASRVPLLDRAGGARLAARVAALIGERTAGAEVLRRAAGRGCERLRRPAVVAERAEHRIGDERRRGAQRAVWPLHVAAAVGPRDVARRRVHRRVVRD